jgi:hypothetical protein
MFSVWRPRLAVRSDHSPTLQTESAPVIPRANCSPMHDHDAPTPRFSPPPCRRDVARHHGRFTCPIAPAAAPAQHPPPAARSAHGPPKRPDAQACHYQPAALMGASVRQLTRSPSPTPAHDRSCFPLLHRHVIRVRGTRDERSRSNQAALCVSCRSCRCAQLPLRRPSPRRSARMHDRDECRVYCPDGERWSAIEIDVGVRPW